MNPDETAPVPQAGMDKKRQGWDAGGLLGLINGVIAAIGGVYVTTDSVLITIIAGGVALLLATLVLWRK